MKYKSCFSLLIVSIILLCASISLVSAKAPVTAENRIYSARDDNREIYIMNPGRKRPGETYPQPC